MAAGINDKFSRTYNAANPNVARVTGTRSAAGTSLSCDNLAGWPTDTVVQFSTYSINTSNAVIAGTQIDWKGIVSGNTIGTLTRITGAADNGSAIGDVVEMNPTATWADNMVTGILVHADQDGTLKAGAVDNAAVLADSIVTSAKVAAGMPVQVVSTNYSAVATGTTTIPRDDTIPQNTEGTEFMSQSITPKSATNILVIDMTMMISSSSTVIDVCSALFQDSTANAIAATYVTQAGSNYGNVLSISHRMVAGTTSATTFKVRAGSGTASTVTFNGTSSARVFGGVTVSSIKVTEYKA